MDKKGKRDAHHASIVQKVAEIAGVSERYVYMVLKGDRVNDNIMLVYMELEEGANKLVAAVKKLVPFEPKDRELIMNYAPGTEADRMKAEGIAV